MRKWLIALFALVALTLAACGSSDSSEKKDDKKEEAEDTEEVTTIKVGATSTPHAEVLEEAKPLLEKEGIELEIEEYQDYILPNDDLARGDLDANYFQHIPYLEQTIADNDYDLINIGGIHIEPMGVYSQNIKSIDDIEDGTEVVISRSVADHGRVLILFEQQGLIKLADDIDKDSAEIDDIVENEKNLEFKAEVDPAFLPEIYESEKDVLVAINTNYAIEAGLSPLDDALFIEGDDSPYVNIIAAQGKDKDNEALKKLVDVLRSEEIQNFISEEYEGAVVPVNE